MVHSSLRDVKAYLQHPLAETYLELVCDWRLWADDLDEALRKIVAASCAALGVQRVGLWSYSERRQSLTLVVMFDTLNRGFSHGAELHCEQYPIYFSHLEAGRIIDAIDVNSDPRTRELIAAYTKPLNIGAMLDATVRVAGDTWGVLCIEHVGGARLWSEPEQWFAVSVADLIAQFITYSEIRHSERHVRFIADNLPIGILNVDTDANCVYANTYWRQLTGLGVEDIRAERWLLAIHPEDRAAIRELVHAVCADSERLDRECRLLVQGKVVWVSCRWVRECNAEGFPIGVLGTFTDIMQERELREQEHRYRVLFDNSGDAIFLMENDRFIDCNLQTLAMFECTREQIVGQAPYRFSPQFQPDGRSSKEKALEKISGAFRGERQFFEWSHARYDGSLFDAEVTLTCVTLDGNPHLLAAVRDVSARKRAQRELAQSNERLHRINQIVARLSDKRDVVAVAKESVAILAEHSSAPLAAFYLYDAASSRADLIAELDARNEAVQRDGLSIAWPGFRSVEDDVGLVSNLADFPIDPALKAEALARGVVSVIYVWLIHEGQRLGVIALQYRETMRMDDAQRADLIAVGKTISMALANVLYIARIEHHSRHDALTGLPNRMMLQSELDKVVQDNSRTAGLLLLDLDRFKEVNDALGHNIGDKLLCRIGPRLQTVLADERSLLCRIGGDEFAVLLRDKSQDELQQIAQSLLVALKEPIDVDGLPLEIGGSIGIAAFPSHGNGGHELLRHADVAMYQAKRSGSGVVVYDSSFDQNTPERLALMQELGAGIRAGQLVVHYQPKIELTSGRVTGFEALVRWQHPQRGLLSPVAFVPFAELGDAIHALTLNVLNQALAQQRQWREHGMHYSIAVNMSARNLLNDDCIRQMKQLLQKYQTERGALELEITETTLMHDPDGAALLLNGLAQLGVKISIDDFGTGYSSLAYLRRLPIHALKIDRAFVTDLAQNEQDAVIVKSTIVLAHNLKLQVVAEGVEDVAAFDLLREMGCDLAQGYYMSKPRSAADIEQWLKLRS